MVGGGEGGRGLVVVLAGGGGDAWGTGIGGYLRCNGGCGIVKLQS